MREIATTTSRCSARTRTSSEAEELHGVLERGDLLGRLLGARLERLPATVDPDHRDLELHARLDVVVVAGRDVHPALLGADAALALLEVGGIGLVGADLLRRDHEVEVEPEVPARLAEQLVVDVRDQA